jgi:hypothetical protein
MMRATAMRLVAAMAVLLAGCGSGDNGTGDPSAPGGSRGGGGGGTTKRDVTVLVYMLGSDLESGRGYATLNLAEMMAVGSTSSVAVLVQTGGAKKGAGKKPADPTQMQPVDIDWTQIQRFQVNEGSLNRLQEPVAEVANEPRKDMGYGQALQDFLQWGVAQAPASRYVVVLWDHGGGVNGGVGSDEVTGTTMSVPRIAAAVQQAMPSGQKFDVVGFDTCFMGTVEVAASLAASARYMVASEDLEPGTGWDYKGFLGYLKQNPQATGEDVGKKIVTTYVAKQRGTTGNSAVTLSVVDLSKMTEVIAATDAFAAALKPYTALTADPAGWKQIAQARARSLAWGTSGIFAYESTSKWAYAADLVDIRQFIPRVVNYLNMGIRYDRPLSEAGDRLSTAIDDAVRASEATGGDSGATGLTIYFPSILQAYPGENYATNTRTVADGTPFFSAEYTDGSKGLLATYHAYYLAKRTSLVATVSMNGEQAFPLRGTLTNDFAYVLASHESAACTFYVEGTKNPYTNVYCIDATQVARDFTKIADSSGWTVDFTGRTRWVFIQAGDGSGSKVPVVLVPDDVGGAATGNYDRYLLPAYLASSDAANPWMGGYLSVEEFVPPSGTALQFRVLGFVGLNSPAGVPGKLYTLQATDQVALGVFYRTDAKPPKPAVARSTNVLQAKNGTFLLSTGTITGGLLSYVVTDLTGASSVTEHIVDYVP